MSLFPQGLSSVLREPLTLFQGCTLNKLVSAYIEQEDVCHARLEEERKKGPLPGPNGGAPLQVSPGLHSTFRSAVWSPFIVAVDLASTSAGRSMSSHLPAAGCSTSSSTAGWGRVFVLQLWADWAPLP
jgi:hypothetical protein